MNSPTQSSTALTLRDRWLGELAHGLVMEAYSDDERGRLRSTIALAQLETVNARERPVAGTGMAGSRAVPRSEGASPEVFPSPVPPMLAPFLLYDQHYRDCDHCQHALTRCKVGNRLWWAWLEVAA